MGIKNLLIYLTIGELRYDAEGSNHLFSMTWTVIDWQFNTFWELRFEYHETGGIQ